MHKILKYLKKCLRVGFAFHYMLKIPSKILYPYKSFEVHAGICMFRLSRVVLERDKCHVVVTNAFFSRNIHRKESILSFKRLL